MQEVTLKQRRSNTRHLRRLLRTGAIKVCTETGRVFWPNGAPVGTVENGGGYLRFKIQRGVCRYFFVHKAVYLATLRPYRHDMTLDHVSGDRKENRSSNLELVTYKENTARARARALTDNIPPGF